ncbi:LamG-like jellyroll fold domain-containing protein [Marinobacterium litorale]|uniref:LamG-like jellyroll fold domain-containing protein n=1 Tax=Marinobacterium litorale TaxID=404770 RepID=UPI000413975B|nr:LamG-like jellyroll fold domain-containing protein [Marinobacterium litorale]
MAIIRLNWTDPNSVEEGYKVYRSTSPIDPGGLPVPLVTLPPGSETFDDTSAAGGSTYYYRIVAFIGSEVKVSNEVVATPEGSSGDPYISNVTALLHFDGEDGSPTMIDSSIPPKNFNPVYGAVLTTTWSATGGSSLQGNGTTRFVASAAADPGFDLLGSDFTVEGYFYFDSIQTNWLFSTAGSAAWNSSNGIHFLLAVDPSGYLQFQISNGTSSPIIWTSTLVIPQGQGVHVACCYVASTNTAYIGVGGTVQSQVLPSTPVRPSGDPYFAAGGIRGVDSSVKDCLAGRADEVRVTKGVARYISNFTPPSVPFPDPAAPKLSDGGLTWRYWRVYVTATVSDPTYCGLQEIKLRSGTTEDLTAPGMSTGQSSFYAGDSATFAKVIDNNEQNAGSNSWITDGSAAPHWGWVDLGSAAKVSHFLMLPQNYSGGPGRAPKDFIIQGSDDGVTWTDVRSFTGVTGWAQGRYNIVYLETGYIV